MRGQSLISPGSAARLALAAAALTGLAPAPPSAARAFSPDARTSTSSAHNVSVAPVELGFSVHVIDTALAGGYQVVVADMNRDGKPDIIAVASGLKEIRWYENPGWTRHVMATGINQPINAAVHDVDGDGIPEVALAYEFSNVYARSVGIVAILAHQGDPSGLWSLKEIDRVPTSHRLRFADVDGRGRKVLVNVPLTGPQAVAPDYRDHVPLLMYRPGDWKREVITDAEQGVVHGVLVTPRDGGTGESLLSASFLGVHSLTYEQGVWNRALVVKGDPADWPRSGASDVVVGQLRGERFLATIEPWHGNQVVVYRQSSGAWKRHVIDETISDGHALVAGDLDGDGVDEIVAGERGGKRSVYLYRVTNAGDDAWSKQALDDGGMAAAGCAVADLNGDTRPDVVCIGTATANLKWYENRSPAAAQISAPPAATQNPSPMVEGTRLHERLAPRALGGELRSFAGPAGKPVELYVPPAARTRDVVDLVVHFHGAAWLPEQAVASLGENAVAAVVNLGTGSGAYDRAFTDPTAFDSLLAGVARELSAGTVTKGEVQPSRSTATTAMPAEPAARARSVRVRRVTLVGFSAGHGAVRAILREPRHAERVSAVLLLDGMHTSYVPEGTVLDKGGALDTTNLVAFASYARAAIRGEKRFVITHSEIFPGTFASTTETADWLLRALGLRRTRVLGWGPRGMQQLSNVHAGRFELLGFAGNAAPDHVDHLHAMPELLTRLLRR